MALIKRNHSLFGSVISALQGNKSQNQQPNRSNSLHINYTQPHPKLSPTNSLHEKHSKISPQESLNNGNVSPGNSYLNVDYRNAINRSPSPMAPSPMNSVHHLSPMTSNDGSRHQSSIDQDPSTRERDIAIEVPGLSSPGDLENIPMRPMGNGGHGQTDLTPRQERTLRKGPFVYRDLPQEDSDYERERSPPTPPPRRRGASIKLACIGKQDSDENPLMRKIATPLMLAQSQAMAVAGMTHDGHHRSIDHPKVLRTPPESPRRVRASYYTPARPMVLSSSNYSQGSNSTGGSFPPGYHYEDDLPPPPPPFSL